jgi:(1->4)-alpha-D-glucan 1-alpha-D-glucosylmutase
MRINAPRRTAVDRELAPDRNDEYLFYQSLLGIWPAEAMDAPIPEEAPPDVVVRMRQFMQKAIKEAKVHTSWFNQNLAYEDAVSRFIDGALTGASGRVFLESFIPFQRRVAIRGMVNSLAQLVLKIASPGVPDFYQGTEEWNLVLADPDNRVPVDFARREATLSELSPWIATSEAIWNPCAPPAPRTACDLDGHVRLLLDRWSDARIKTFLMACGLRLRRHERRLLLHGGYLPIFTDGTAASHLVGFVRFSEGNALLAVIPRLMSPHLGDELALPTGPETWGDTRIGLPRDVASGPWRNIFTGATVTPVDDERGAEVFQTCPVALLWSQPEGRPVGTGARLSV